MVFVEIVMIIQTKIQVNPLGKPTLSKGHDFTNIAIF